MSLLTQSPAWKALEAHQKIMALCHMRELFEKDPHRFEKFSLHLNGMLLDYSKNLITEETMQLLLALAEQFNVKRWAEKMFSGEKINTSENRAALHTALRNPTRKPLNLDGKDIMREVQRNLDHMSRFSDAVRSGNAMGHSGKPFTDVVNIGIGGSYLGPLMADEALKPYGSPYLRVHFVSNVDGTHLTETIKPLNPETTLFIVASKSFSTQETLLNANSARQWLLTRLPSEAAAKHFVAITAKPKEAAKFGVPANHVFEMWDWVGGRYSLWSAIGLPVAISIGMDNFNELLAGANLMDEHFLSAPLDGNMPVILALLGIWYNNFFGAETYAVLPYDQYLRYLPVYLQQLEMESNGKQVNRAGEPVDYATAPIIWGEAGTNGQHTFYQLMYQGTRLIPADFLASCETHNPLNEHHAVLLSHFFAQSEALMQGRTESEIKTELGAQGVTGENSEQWAKYETFPGNQPSNCILFRKLDPKTLGSLIALYEHKVFVEGVIWNINSFDQWGVEVGKRLAARIRSELSSSEATGSHDASTNGLINCYKLNK
ncbi:MAG: glucose-6-phosphate isomerase [Burkholderiales bacterium]